MIKYIRFGVRLLEGDVENVWISGVNDWLNVRAI